MSTRDYGTPQRTARNTWNDIIPINRDEEIAKATKDTALCASNSDLFPHGVSRRAFFNHCERKENLNYFKDFLNSDPTFAIIRQTDKTNYGFTPLHAAANKLNYEALTILLASNLVSSWSLDLIGRTALHLASVSNEKNDEDRLKCCQLLRNSMINEKGVDPIGSQAPVDLAGYSPMGLTKGKASPAIKNLLFRPGDPSVLPSTPKSTRIGSSPLFSPVSILSSRQNYLASRTKSALHTLDERFDSTNELVDRFDIQSESSSATTNIITNHASDIVAINETNTPVHTSTGIQQTTSIDSMNNTSDTWTTVDEQVENITTQISNIHMSDTTATTTNLSNNITIADINRLDISETVTYGYSVAQGWNEYMEDQICVYIPLHLDIPFISSPSSPRADASTGSIDDQENDNRMGSVWISSGTDHKIDAEVSPRPTTDETTTWRSARSLPQEYTETIDIPTEFSTKSTEHDTQMMTTTTTNPKTPPKSNEIHKPITIGVCVVCDGHGGSFTAKYLIAHIKDVLIHTYTDACKSYLQKIHSGTDTIIGLEELYAHTSTPTFWSSILIQVCEILEEQLRTHPRMGLSTANAIYGKEVYKDTSGSTAVISLITTTDIITANVGDSRAVLGKYRDTSNNSTSTYGNTEVYLLEAEALTTDHKFHRVIYPDECTRALGAGAELIDRDDGYSDISVANNLNSSDVNILRMSRSFGDFLFKRVTNLPRQLQPVIAVPSITVHPRSPRDQFLVLASDGIWDYMTNQEVVNFISQAYYPQTSTPLSETTDTAAVAAAAITIENQSVWRDNNIDDQEERLAYICDQILEKCLNLGGMDNMSIIIVDLQPHIKRKLYSKGYTPNHISKTINITINKNLLTRNLSPIVEQNDEQVVVSHDSVGKKLDFDSP